MATKRGFPPHVPTDELRRKVDSLAGLGITQPIIGKIIGISDRTLRKHYGEILQVAEHRVNAMLAENIVRLALGRDAVYDQNNRLVRSEVAANVAAAIFLAKVRLGYKEPIVAKSQDDRDIKIVVEGGLPKRSFSD